MATTAVKRFLVGRPISSYREVQHRLSKKIALAVFSSDALSSSAYATDEILLALVLAGSAALSFSVPIGIAVTVVLSIVIASYRQTVRAYPNGGGAYIVAHDNLGAFPGLIAGSALLVDYVLTVAVSVAGGVAAVGAAFPAVREQRSALAVAAVAVITAMNLRGLKESGTVFAVPTYGFLLSMFVMISLGVFKFLTGNLEVKPPAHVPAEQALTLFLILRAFASGSTALTGVEAISNGVPAFKKPESKNAADTLLILACLLGFLFLGITFLARAVHVDPHLIEEGKTVPSQIAAAVFGPATFFFYVVQAFTAGILFLAANTSFADFPRLASVMAKDRYLPRALQNRGDRLAFSNGILVLAFFASGVLLLYSADVHKIIPLYVIGVFTSFTLSQAGMVKRWIRDANAATSAGDPPPPGWRRFAAINGVGALTTLFVLIIVSVTKFTLGAWQVMIMIPVIAWALHGIGAHFKQVAEELRLDDRGPRVQAGPVLVALSRKEGATKALVFARTIAPMGLRVVAMADSEPWLADLRQKWDEMGVRVSIESIGRGLRPLKEVVASMDPSPVEPVSIVLPDIQYSNRLVQLAKNVQQFRVKRAFLSAVDTVVISVPFHPELEAEPDKLRGPGRFALIVFVSSVDKAALRAVQYAQSLHPSSLEAMSIQTLPGEAASLTHQWSRLPMDVPVEIVDSPFRSLMQPVINGVRALGPNPNDAVGVVVPEFVVRHWWHAMLHNQTGFLIKSALLFEPNVVVMNVPYPLGKRENRSSLAEERVGTPPG